jgi:3-isopropylmalate/(R)-2-methylmalate dehydratase small subunit
MKPFERFTGVAAPLPIANLDTDQLVPARYLKGTTRDGLGDALLASLRYDQSGAEQPGFILNGEPWRKSEILIGLENFGCGSSREHAPWALADFGIKAILAPSFADIFYSNCFKNGLLAARLDPPAIQRLLELVSDPASSLLEIDLELQQVVAATGERFLFEIDAEKREALLQGLDEINRSLQFGDAIAEFEKRHLGKVPPIPGWPELAARLA